MSRPQDLIEVAVALPLQHTLTYSVPPALRGRADCGKRVLIPFGRPSASFGQRKITGYILGPAASVPDTAAIKPVIEILDDTPLFPPAMLPLFKWTSDYYLRSIGEVIQCALPGSLTLADQVTFAITESGRALLRDARAGALELAVLDQLQKQALSSRQLSRRLGRRVPAALLRGMARNGLVAARRRLKSGTVRPLMQRMVTLVKSDIPEDRFAARRREIIDLLAQCGSLPLKTLKQCLPGLAGYLPFLEKHGVIEVQKKPVYRDPFGESIAPDTPPHLTDEQQAAFNTLKEAFGKGFCAFLLAGVTGSGKTEIYLRLAAEVMAAGATVLVLVPEIALISQMERRFRARFGERVALLHSGLSAGERYDQWRRIVRHEVAIAVGTRSAVFAPFDNLGLVVVDEEHDSSYKEQRGLLYNARDLSVVRAKLAQATVLLGSATPCMQSLYNARQGKFRLLRLTRRVAQRPLPHIETVDLRRKSSSRSADHMISPRLKTAIATTLAHHQQVLLFLNRRGFAGFPVCSACGRPVRCKNCDISLTLHRAAGVYKCHYCGLTRPAAIYCEACGSAAIKPLGLGTEKIESAVKSLFPAATVARMDADTTAARGSLVRILKGLRNGRIDILIGTQMVAKGHDFPNITLVGIICADLTLNFPDFRAAERTFQLLAQVAGRTGRGTSPGRVILQTFNPEHFSIAAARKQDVDLFYDTEIVFRTQLGYPPTARMVQLRISGRDARKTRLSAAHIGDGCRKLLRQPEFDGQITVLGPIESPLARLANRYRWQILLCGPRTRALHRFTRRLIFDKGSTRLAAGTRLEVDVDPVFMM